MVCIYGPGGVGGEGRSVCVCVRGKLASNEGRTDIERLEN